MSKDFTISQETYLTNTDNSFLKALGPYRLDTASEAIGGLFITVMENLSHTIKVGNVTYHSTLLSDENPIEIQHEFKE